MKYARIREEALSEWNDFVDGNRPRILIGTGTCGKAAGADDLLECIRAYLDANGLDALVCETGCLGLCYAEPLVELEKSGSPRMLYGKLSPDNIAQCLDSYFKGESTEGAPEALAVMGEDAVDGIPPFKELPMIRGQVRIASRNCGIIAPENINHYVARGGYSGLDKALQMTPEEVIEEIKQAGLRGRGGAGFPTATKWEFCRKAESDEKYMICNADEGDPGAFMDRSLIESDPHSVIEGIVIAAYAIGAGHGYIYVRAEYPLAVGRLEKAIEQATAGGFLGDNILDGGFSCHITIKKGAGAFVCGEETALIASIEGRRGMPRTRPPFPAVSGLHGKPTTINNVETLASVSAIMAMGSDAYAANGTEKSRGTKTFALAGKIARTGLIEVPLGMTLREIVFDIGGGIPGDKQFKAVQTGGPSGGCIPAELLDLPVDYERLAEAGAIMGSGGMVVMDETTCMVDIARYFVSFTENESCGKCTPCRLGTRQMLQILDGIAAGKGEPADVDLLAEIAEAVNLGSLCGLGQTAPNPVLTTIKYYRNEYDEHVLNHRCPAGQCMALLEYVINEEACTGCSACAKKCPVDAISGEVKKTFTIDQDKCIKCGICYDVCKFDAVDRS
jgi:NADH-quinone oxidoreductase subunit F